MSGRGLRRVVAIVALVLTACASTQGPPTHFGRWGPVAPVREPDRSVLVAAITAASAANPKAVVLARYAGDIYRRLDLASLDRQVPVSVDSAGRLGPIDTGKPQYRARVFEADFPGKTTILELSAPKVRGGTATVTVTRWDGRAWTCQLSGKSEQLTLRLENEHWKVTSASAAPEVLILKAGCP